MYHVRHCGYDDGRAHLVTVGELVAQHDHVVHLSQQAEVLRELVFGYLGRRAAQETDVHGPEGGGFSDGAVSPPRRPSNTNTTTTTTITTANTNTNTNTNNTSNTDTNKSNTPL